MNMPVTSVRSIITFIVIFGIAMGFLEASVVVYLRQLYYPDGFTFPLRFVALEKLSIEYLREVSTVVMLLSVSIVAGKNFYAKMSYFLLCFGIWDIFYYVWLKVLLNWPPSFLTWDILFLIPVVWAGPVLAPIICATTMVIVAGSVLSFQQRDYPVRIRLPEWGLLFSGAMLIFITFIWDYSKIIMQKGLTLRLLTLRTDPYFQEIVAHYVPVDYQWSLFLSGESLILCFLVVFFRRTMALKPVVTVSISLRGTGRQGPCLPGELTTGLKPQGMKEGSERK
jgi:hypothetical protein